MCLPFIRLRVKKVVLSYKQKQEEAKLQTENDQLQKQVQSSRKDKTQGMPSTKLRTLLHMKKKKKAEAAREVKIHAYNLCDTHGGAAKAAVAVAGRGPESALEFAAIVNDENHSDSLTNRVYEIVDDIVYEIVD